MNLNKIRERLEKFNKPKTAQKYEKIDYTKYYWKPSVGKHQIRIVPSKYDKENPFREINFHYGIAKFPILSLTNWNEKDPIVEFCKSLRTSKDPEDWKLAKKLSPKQRIFIPVLVRGEEDKGVRLWEVGVTVYKQLLALADDEDYGDYTSITDGRDFTVEINEEKKFEKMVKVVSSIRIKPKTSILSENADEVTKYLEEQPDVLSLNKKQTYDDIKGFLEKFLGEDDEVSNDTSVVNNNSDDLPFEDEKDELEDIIPSTPHKAKKSKADEFDKLFK